MKSILAGIGVVVSLATLITCVIALDWVWSIKKPTIEKTTQAFDRAEEVLNLAYNAIESVMQRLDESRHRMDLVRHASDQASSSPNFFERAAARAMVKTVTPSVSDAQHSLEKVTEASIVVNSILESLHDTDVGERFDTNQVRQLQTLTDNVARASWDLSDLLHDPLRRDGDESASQKSARIAASLEEVIRLAGEYQQSVVGLKNRLNVYRATTMKWMVRTPPLATAALGWVGISQIVVLMVSGRYLLYHRRQRPAIAAPAV